MAETFPSVLILGGASPKIQVARRVATALVALLLISEVSNQDEMYGTYFKHLNEGDAQVHISHVSEDQAQAEHGANGYNGTPG